MKKTLLSALLLAASLVLKAEDKPSSCENPPCEPVAQSQDLTLNPVNNAADDDGAVEATEQDLLDDQNKDQNTAQK